METQISTIRDIRKKVEKLLRQLDVLKRENASFKNNISQLETRSSELQAELEKSHQQNLLYKASVQQLDGKEKKQLDSTITAYINQLNKAIALLSE